MSILNKGLLYILLNLLSVLASNVTFKTEKRTAYRAIINNHHTTENVFKNLKMSITIRVLVYKEKI
jgi:hypothetical protein